jgi:hypothetical protein
VQVARRVGLEGPALAHVADLAEQLRQLEAQRAALITARIQADAAARG